MKKRFMVLVIVMGLLGITQIDSGRDRMENLQRAAFADYLGANGYGLNVNPQAAGGSAVLAANIEKAPGFPEPMTFMLFGLGLLGMSSLKRRFK